MLKTRWVFSPRSPVFSPEKSYNLDSLTVGTTEDPTVSRMTIATFSDDETFEQIKKQLNRMVEVIGVLDFTECLRSYEGNPLRQGAGLLPRR